MPAICACCGEPTTNLAADEAQRLSGQKRVRTARKLAVFPVCPTCIEHVAARPDIANYVLLSLFTCLLATPIAIGVYLARQRRARELRKPTCECVTCLVNFVTWDRNDKLFRVGSRRFAEAMTKHLLAAGKPAVADLEKFPEPEA